MYSLVLHFHLATFFALWPFLSFGFNGFWNHNGSLKIKPLNWKHSSIIAFIFSSASASWLVGTVVGHQYGWLRNGSTAASSARWLPDLSSGWEYRPLVRGEDSLSSWQSDDGTLRIESLRGEIYIYVSNTCMIQTKVKRSLHGLKIWCDCIGGLFGHIVLFHNICRFHSGNFFINSNVSHSIKSVKIVIISWYFLVHLGMRLSTIGML